LSQEASVAEEDKVVIICKRAASPTHVPSTLITCMDCGEPIWLAHSTPLHHYAKIICWECAPIAEIKVEDIMAPTPEQMAEIEAYVRRG
jgi:hypothetical protein